MVLKTQKIWHKTTPPLIYGVREISQRFYFVTSSTQHKRDKHTNSASESSSRNSDSETELYSDILFVWMG